MDKLKFRFTNRLGVKVALGEAWTEPVAMKVDGKIENAGRLPHLLAPVDLVEETLITGGAHAQLDAWNIAQGAATVAWIRGQRTLAVLVSEHCADTRSWRDMAHTHGHMSAVLVTPSRRRIVVMPMSQRYAAAALSFLECPPLEPGQLSDMVMSLLSELENPGFIASLGFPEGELHEVAVSIHSPTRLMAEVIELGPHERQLH